MRRLRAALLFLRGYDRSMRATLWGAASVALSLITIPAWGQGAVTAGQLPAGDGRDITAGKCVVCHDAGRLVYPGHTREGWQSVIGRMVKLGPTVVPAAGRHL